MTLPLPTELPGEFVLKARYVFSSDAAPREDVCLAIAQGHVVEIASPDSFAANSGAASNKFPVYDLGNCALIPGLVNAHTHLEFSEIRAPLGEPGMPLPDWIRLVIAWRQQNGTDSITRALAAGWQESVRSGATELGEISTHGWNAAALAGVPLRVTAFRELIATDPQLAAERVTSAVKEAAKVPSSGELALMTPGLSPHAPYSTSMELVQQTVKAAVHKGWPVAIHLAESPQEIEYLATGEGPFRQLLEELGVWHTAAFAPPSNPLDYLKILAAAPHAYVIHGNYLSDEEVRFLADNRERMTLVYCPRTHAYFGHQAYPLAKVMESGVRLAIGTDSRASNPDLNIFAELQFLARRADVPHAKILEWGTQPLIANSEVRDAGRSLSAGSVADLVIVALPEHQVGDPLELLFAEESRVAATVIAGRLFLADKPTA